MLKKAAGTDQHKITTIPNFDGRHFNVSYHRAEQIYSSSPTIGWSIRQLEFRTSESGQGSALLDACIEISKHVGSRYGFVEWPNRNVKDSDDNPGAVFCLLDHDAIPSSASHSAVPSGYYTMGTPPFGGIHVVGELNRNDRPGGTRRRLARRAYKIMYDQKFRQHILAFSLQQTRMRSFVFGLNGAWSSDEFDIRLNPVRFVRILASCLSMSGEELGYDPTFTVHPGGRTTLSMTRSDTVYQLNEDSCVFIGRTTSIWKATTETGESVFIKDCWQSEDRNEEGDMLKRAIASEASLFPEDFNPKDKDKHHIRDWPTPRRFASYIYHERVQCENSSLNGSNKVFSIARPRRPDPHDGCVQAALDCHKSRREHHRVVTKYVDFQMIEDLNSPLDLFTAIRDCVDGHWALYRAGVLHRAVSKDNLLVAIKKEEQKFDHGFVIDLDFAADPDLSILSESVATGNKQFMGREVLKWLSDCQLSYEYYQSALRHGDSGKAQKLLTTYKLRLSGFKQEYRHDLESFYWVLLWCLFQMSDTSEVKMMNTFNTWKDPGRTFKEVFAVKSAYFTADYKEKNYFTDLVDLDSATAEVTFGSLLVSLTDVISDTNILAALPAEELYCRFQRALTKIIEFLTEAY